MESNIDGDVIEEESNDDDDDADDEGNLQILGKIMKLNGYKVECIQIEPSSSIETRMEVLCLADYML